MFDDNSAPWGPLVLVSTPERRANTQPRDWKEASVAEMAARRCTEPIEPVIQFNISRRAWNSQQCWVCSKPLAGATSSGAKRESRTVDHLLAGELIAERHDLVTRLVFGGTGENAAGASVLLEGSNFGPIGLVCSAEVTAAI